MKFKVGQKWETRDGRVATIKSTTRDSENYPIVVTIGDDPFEWIYRADGEVWVNQTKPHDRDLVRLIAEPEGWVKWEGGKNPVPGAYVEYRMRDEYVCDDESDMLRWDHRDELGDIVAYKVTREAPVPESEPKPEPFTITEPGEYVTRDGRKAVVTAANMRGECPVLGYVVEAYWDSPLSWCANGRVYVHGSDNPRDLVGRWVHYAGIAIDTPVWVRDDPRAAWVPRHFAGVKDGKPLAWANGLTSHTAQERKEEEPLTWEELSLTKPE